MSGGLVTVHAIACQAAAGTRACAVDCVTVNRPAAMAELGGRLADAVRQLLATPADPVVREHAELARAAWEAMWPDRFADRRHDAARFVGPDAELGGAL